MIAHYCAEQLFMWNRIYMFLSSKSMTCATGECSAPTAVVGDTVKYTHTFDQRVSVSSVDQKAVVMLSGYRTGNIPFFLFSAAEPRFQSTALQQQ